MPMMATGPVRLHYYSRGEGEVLVFIHGLGANMAFWLLNIAAGLAQNYRVITYDLRGHGRSDAPPSGYRLPEMVDDLNALLDYLDVPSAHVVGHSHGARVGLSQAIVRPERVRTLTVADTQIASLQPRLRLRDWPHWPEWRRQLREQGVHALPDDGEYITFRLLARFNQFGSAIVQGDMAQGAAGVRPSLRTRDMGRRGGLRWAQLMESTSAAQEFDDENPLTQQSLASINVPTLGVFGEYSHCIPTGQALPRVIPNYRMVVIPGVGHFHPAIRPRMFMSVLRGFLARQDRPGQRQNSWM
jgi:pimeloyl-ACP methyl ester carboxylesterase